MTTPKSTSESATNTGQESENPKPKKKGGKQPKHHAPKTRAASQLRRKKILKAVIEGKNPTQAGIDSGLSPKTASDQVAQILREPRMLTALQAEMEKQGLSDSYLIQQHRALIEGTKVISATVIQGAGSADLKDAGSMTKDFIEVPDNQAKAKGLELAYKLKGALTDKHEVDIKQPVTIVIKKFCSRGQKPPESATPGGSPA